MDSIAGNGWRGNLGWHDSDWLFYAVIGDHAPRHESGEADNPAQPDQDRPYDRPGFSRWLRDQVGIERELTLQFQHRAVTAELGSEPRGIAITFVSVSQWCGWASGDLG